MIRYFAFVIVALSISSVGGAERNAKHSATLAPFLDEQSIAVAHVDLTRIDIDHIVERVGLAMPAWDPERERVIHLVRETHDALRSAGADEIYVVVSITDIPEHPPVLVIPASNNVDEDAVRKLTTPYGASVAREGDVLAIAHEETLARFKSNDASPRPEVDAALEAAGDGPVRIAFIPTPMHRKIVREMMPRLPEEFGGGSMEVVASGLVWAAASGDLSKSSDLAIVVQSEDAVAAKGFRDLLAKRVPEFIKDIAPDISVRESQVVWAFSDQNVVRLLEALGAGSSKARERSLHEISMNQLKQFALAMHNYHDAIGHFPMPANYDADGKPLLSWRVHVLPFVGEKELYNEFHLDEPWDSEHNRKLIDRMPDIYRSPLQSRDAKGKTAFLAPVGKGAIFEPNKERIFKDISDGSSNTILLVEVGPKNAVTWTRPDDLEFNPENPLEGIGKSYPEGFNVLLADGSAIRFDYSMPAETLRAWFTAAGREKILH